MCPPKRVAKPKTSTGKKEEKRKAKKEKLAEELTEKAKAQEEAARMEAESKIAACMGTKLEQILDQIQTGQLQPDEKKKQSRPDKKKERLAAIAQMQSILVDDGFTQNPAGAFGIVDHMLDARIQQNQQKQ